MVARLVLRVKLVRLLGVQAEPLRMATASTVAERCSASPVRRQIRGVDRTEVDAVRVLGNRALHFCDASTRDRSELANHIEGTATARQQSSPVEHN